MRSWPRPTVPTLLGESPIPYLHDTSVGRLVKADPGNIARLYVCGITPYDATHIGHAATYIAFDTLQRVWLDAGLEVHYAQNITDIDDPLLERAATTGVDWHDLAEEQIELFRHDMSALSVLPPDDYVAVTEVIDEISDAVGRLLEQGVAYAVPTEDSESDDIYFDVRRASDHTPWHLGEISNLDEATMRTLFAERGGDPDRPGKRDPLDPLLWRAARPGEPRWPSALGPGRPGWHIECSVIALRELGTDFTVQGGASDLIFPHHELSAAHAARLSGQPLALVYSHAGLVAYEGEKMSKSLGNLVLVSELRRQGVDPGAIRLSILAHHYRSDWEWTDSVLADGTDRLARWRSIRSGDVSAEPIRATGVLAGIRAALCDDLDTPRALALVDEAVHGGVDDVALLARVVHALLGIEL
ncbi:cysteine--1-D-myo-inosityl 2-amino-2-deoxy-alpha-D-glucopyranoside ligase [Okibacterium endophyticum]